MLYIGFLYIQRELDNFSHIPKSASSSSSSWLDSSHVSILIVSGSSVSSEILFDAISASFPSSLISASISKPCASGTALEALYPLLCKWYSFALLCAQYSFRDISRLQFFLQLNFYFRNLFFYDLLIKDQLVLFIDIRPPKVISIVSKSVPYKTRRFSSS